MFLIEVKFFLEILIMFDPMTQKCWGKQVLNRFESKEVTRYPEEVFHIAWFLNKCLIEPMESNGHTVHRTKLTYTIQCYNWSCFKVSGSPVEADGALFWVGIVDWLTSLVWKINCWIFDSSGNDFLNSFPILIFE